jgi:hypothetical protein
VTSTVACAYTYIYVSPRLFVPSLLHSTSTSYFTSLKILAWNDPNYTHNSALLEPSVLDTKYLHHCVATSWHPARRQPTHRNNKKLPPSETRNGNRRKLQTRTTLPRAQQKGRPNVDETRPKIKSSKLLIKSGNSRSSSVRAPVIKSRRQLSMAASGSTSYRPRPARPGKMIFSRPTTISQRIELEP